MHDLINLSARQLSVLIGNTAAKKGLSSAIIEKDLWVCVVLSWLFTESSLKECLAFKGGTSLSKAYNLIERFSEDVDLILDWRVLGYSKDEPLNERSANQQDKFNKDIIRKTADFLRETFMSEIQHGLEELTKRSLDISFDDDDAAIVINYGTTYSDRSILHGIRLEIGALAAWTPTQTATIRPYIAESYPERFGSNSVNVRTTTPERTFWEKATILHREAFRAEGTTIPLRMSRHYYDIDRMAQLGILDSALEQPELLAQVADFKAKFYPQRWAHYELARPGSLRLSPPKDSLASLENDYSSMADMIYGEHPDFAELMVHINEIEQEINQNNLDSGTLSPQ